MKLVGNRVIWLCALNKQYKAITIRPTTETTTKRTATPSNRMKIWSPSKQLQCNSQVSRNRVAHFFFCPPCVPPLQPTKKKMSPARYNNKTKAIHSLERQRKAPTIIAMWLRLRAPVLADWPHSVQRKTLENLYEFLAIRLIIWYYINPCTVRCYRCCFL